VESAAHESTVSVMECRTSLIRRLRAFTVMKNVPSFISRNVFSWTNPTLPQMTG